MLSVLIYLTTTVTTNVRADEFMDGIASGQYGEHAPSSAKAKPRHEWTHTAGVPFPSQTVGQLPQSTKPR